MTYQVQNKTKQNKISENVSYGSVVRPPFEYFGKQGVVEKNE